MDSSKSRGRRRNYQEDRFLGREFERLRVLGVSSGRRGRWNTVYECVCSCGNTRKIKAQLLLQGTTKSCGCLRRSQVTSHGKSGSPEYIAWISMMGRCYCPTHTAFPHYQKKGIKVCEKWKNSFDEFLKDMGQKPSSKYTVERIDNDGDYEPSNCRWATKKEQCRNRSSNRVITHNGQTKCLTEWAEEMGMKLGTLKGRIEKGWTIERCLTQQVAFRRPRRKIK